MATHPTTPSGLALIQPGRGIKLHFMVEVSFISSRHRSRVVRHQQRSPVQKIDRLKLYLFTLMRSRFDFIYLDGLSDRESPIANDD